MADEPEERGDRGPRPGHDEGDRAGRRGFAARPPQLENEPLELHLVLSECLVSVFRSVVGCDNRNPGGKNLLDQAD